MFKKTYEITRREALRRARDSAECAEAALDWGRMDLARIERDRAWRWRAIAERLSAPRRFIPRP